MATQIVSNIAGFIAALANPDIDYIYLAENITLSSGVTILATKAALVIDGEYPAGSGQIHSITDYESNQDYAAFGIHSSSAIVITMKNLILNGRNYYGMPYIAPYVLGFVDTHLVVVTYENIVYTGPQLSFHINGRTVYNNCNITIRQTGTVESQEVGEVNEIIFRGENSITHESTVATRAVFWFRDSTQTSTMTVESGAVVNIRSINNYFMYNLDGTFGTTRVPVNFVIQNNGILNMEINKGFSYNSSHIIDNFQVGSNARFHYIQTTNNTTYATLYMNGTLSCGSGSDFLMRAANSLEPLINFSSGTNSRIELNNPKSFVLYCQNDPALHAVGTTSVSFNAGQLNQWMTGGSGDFNDTPDYKWHKHQYAQTLNVSGTFTAAGTSVTSNLTADDLPYPDINFLALHNARVLSAGDWQTVVNTIYDNGTPITGTTEPLGNIKIEYEYESATKILYATADENGNFTVEIDVLQAGITIQFSSNIPYLIKEWTESVEGTIVITEAPDIINYRIDPISLSPILLPRLLNESIIITDTRLTADSWTLTAKITNQLTATDGHIIPNAVVFRKDGVLNVLSETLPTSVYTGGETTGVTTITWNENEGMLIEITVPVHTGVVYSSEIIWELEH